MTFIKKGSQGPAVTELQNILRELDYNFGFLLSELFPLQKELEVTSK